MDSVDISTRKYYYDRLYERYQNEAAELGVEDNLMSKFHIKWELSIHVLGCILHHKSAYKAHLNFDDTIWSMLERI